MALSGREIQLLTIYHLRICDKYKGDFFNIYIFGK